MFDVGELEKGYKVKGGAVNPRIETLFKISSALGASLEQLFGHDPLDEETGGISRLLEGKAPALENRRSSW